jgi:hypothetical protein
MSLRCGDIGSVVFTLFSNAVRLRELGAPIALGLYRTFSGENLSGESLYSSFFGLDFPDLVVPSFVMFPRGPLPLDELVIGLPPTVWSSDPIFFPEVAFQMTFEVDGQDLTSGVLFGAFIPTC